MLNKEELQKLNKFKKMCDKAGNYALLQSFTDLNKLPILTLLEEEAVNTVKAEILSRMNRN